ncbi:MAG: 50S ribosomal protein L23 [Candidatus Eremiobacteraeota bacterium]|nr:50S ribosomal protein L23 [Candidatus Eremiobacteraeota bacterium]MBV8371884.1 50S ribosomal protein L23 [Candidatus Eremiobacteraeota bacterium]
MASALGQQYTFAVNPRATKTQIRHAIEELFKVNVIKVNTVNVRGKARQFARRGLRTSGKQSDSKKAVVTLRAGQKIELGGVNYFEQ